MSHSKDLVLRCYAEREPDGDWFAMCIDLNLYARADSFEDAAAKLNGFISSYLREALTVDKAHLFELVPRKAPLRFVARWWYIRSLYFVLHLLERGNQQSSHVPFKRKFSDLVSA